jgi:hypothetical protein
MTLHAWCILAFLLPWATFSVGQGTFEHPSARERAFFRYWLPDASVDGSILAQDIVSAGDVGAGGIELVPFYQYGLYTGRYPPGADWSTYGFGTPAYNTLFKQALEAHRDAGLLMDFALGPNQGQGVPADADDEGLQWDLVCFMFTTYVSPEAMAKVNMTI